MIQPPFDVAARPARRRAFDDRRGHRRLLRVAAWLAVMVAALSQVPASVQTPAAVTDRGATLTNAALMPVGRAPLPNALPFESVASQLTEADGRLVSARGVVRRVHVSTGNVEVTISTVAGRFTLMQPDGAQPDLTPVDAVVSVHGVLSHLLTADRATDRVEMLAAAGAVRIEVQPVGDPFAAPLIDHAGLQEITPIGALRHRVRIAGIVTRQRPGRSLYIRAAGKPVFVETESTQPAAPGDRVEVVGFPDLDDYAPFLAENEVTFNAHVLLERVGNLPRQLRGGERLPRSFRLLLRDASDVAILAAGPTGSVASLGLAGLVFKRGREKETTIRRQLARESSLKTRFDDLFERSSEIMIIDDRRGRISTINRAGEQATA